MDKLNNIPKENFPKHIGLILDGNRRWAREHNMNINMGHLAGYKTLRERLFDFFDLGIRYLSIYALSLENARKRSPEELKYIHKIILKAVDTVKKEPIIKREQIKINVFGRIYLLPEEVQKKIEELIDFTKDHNNAFLNILIMYDGRAEIVDAVKKIIKDDLKSDNITDTTIKSYLYTKDFPEVDYIIRTGMTDGARISGFLLWDASYAEFKFREEYWPDYDKAMMIEDLIDFVNRKRRKGE